MVLEGLSRLFLAGVTPTGFDDASWRTHWLRNHADRGELYYEYDVFHPRFGWTARPGLRDKPVFDGKRLSTNSLGFRGRTEPSLEKPEEVDTRVLVLGDSFTFGEEVGDEQTYSARLQELLPGAEVLNFGMHGYGHDQMLVLFRELGRRYQPDVVVLGFVYADIYRNLLSFRDYAKPHYVVEGEELTLQGVPVPSPEVVLESAWRKPKLLEAASMGWTWIELATGRLEERARRLTVRLLDSLVTEIEDVGARPLLVYLPVGMEWLNSQSGMLAGEQFFLDYCTERALQCVSLTPAFRDFEGAIYEVPGQLHWGPGGHRAAALAIREFIDRSPDFRARP